MAQVRGIDPSIVTGKRKRAQTVSANNYAELDDYLNETFGDEADELVEDVADDDVNDGGTYGKKPPKKPLKKSAKRARSNAKPKKEKTFPLLDLPAELRQEIYEYALLTDNLTLNTRLKGQRRQVYRKDCEGRHPGTCPWAKSLVPNLLAVNKQIRDETIGILYQQPITVVDTYTLHSFLATIGPENRRAVTDITVKGWGDGRGVHKAMNYAALTLLAECVNLKSFFLDCELGWRIRNGKSLARQMFRDGSHFLFSYGNAQGNMAAALKILRFKTINSRNWSRTSQSEAEERKGFEKELRRLLGMAEDLEEIEVDDEAEVEG